MASPRRARLGRRLLAAPGWLAAVLLVLAVASVGVAGSGFERAGSIVEVASGPTATPGAGAVSQAGDGPAAELDAAVLGRPPGDARGSGTSGEDQGGDGAKPPNSSSGEAGGDQPAGTSSQAGSGPSAGSEPQPPSGSAAAAPSAGSSGGGGIGDTVDGTVDGVTDSVPDLPKPVPVPDDVVDGILDDPKLPRGLDLPDRRVP